MTTTAVAGERETLERIARGLRMTTVALPHLAGLAAATRVALDDRIPTMGVFASGRLLANPQFVRRLKDNELVFVLAHELLHLALRTHDRAKGSDRLQFNYAHDYIINDILRAELGFGHIPANGLDMPGAREKSAEEILLGMRRNEQQTKTRVFEGEATSTRRMFGGGQGQAADSADEAGDVLGDQRERESAGYGGSDLSPAMLRLADEPHVRAAVVITDGDIAYPPEPVPYNVLWVLPARDAARFQPPYGRVVAMDAH